MHISINNLIESISNPDGRFATLKGIYPHLDQDGEPRYEILGCVINFKVCYEHKDYKLRCFVNDNVVKADHHRAVAHQISKMRSTEVLVSCRFLPNEMLVYDSEDKPVWVDVGLVEVASGLPLDQYILNLCDSKSHKTLEALRKEFCRSAVKLLQSGFLHGGVKPSNIRVSETGKIKFVNYHRVITPDLLSYTHKRNVDTVPIAMIAIVLTAVSQNLFLYRSLGGSLIFRLGTLREMLVPAILKSLNNLPETSFRKIIEMLIGSNDMIRDSDQLCTLLENTSNENIRFKIDASFESRATNSRKDDDVETESDILEDLFDESIYDTIEDGGENMKIVSKNGFYGCLSSENKEVGVMIYQSVDIFSEGRSVVVREDHEGLIDKNGVEVIPALLDSVSWYADSGVALCESDGNYWSCNRSGKKIVDLDYDWVGEMAFGLIPVRGHDDGKCGYIDKSGDIVIPLIYDDAYSFDEGLGLVAIGETEYQINLKGELIDLEKPKSAKVKLPERV